MKLVVDDKIPHISSFFTQCDDVVYLPGEQISNHDLRDADALITRTVTKINAPLLDNTAVKFVGTTTTGTDHIDIPWLAKNNITLATAAGANSQAVAEYVLCCLAALYKKDLLHHKKVAGIIGCGRIGRIVANIFQTLGFEVICYDPLLTEKCHFNFVSLDTVLSESDIISIHTPLTKIGSHPTFHFINDDTIKKIKPDAILINTARGEVIDQHALLQTKNMILCLDVWENEPHICLELLHKVLIGTPHIAGYSLDAKYCATQMIYERAAEFFGWSKIIPKKNKPSNGLLSFLKSDWINKALSNYDPLTHTEQLRKVLTRCDDIAKTFITARANYPLRRSG